MHNIIQVAINMLFTINTCSHKFMLIHKNTLQIPEIIDTELQLATMLMCSGWLFT